MKEQLMLKSIKLSNEILLGTVVDLVNSGSDVKINIAGSSMKPFLYDGDVVLLRQVNLSSVKRGDIVLGRYLGAYVLHRMIRRGNECIYIAGDNNLSQLEKIEREYIYAKAIALVVNGKNVNLTNFCSRWRGLIWYYLRPFRKVFFKIFN